MEKTKGLLLAAAGAIGAACSNFLGGWDMALQTLIGFMVADYITGVTVAAVFVRSDKTESGALSSAAGIKGLFRKGGMLLLVYIACRLDALSGGELIRDAVVAALVANEGVSVLENLGAMGVPMPAMIIRALEQLGGKENEDDKADNRPFGT